jgi:hypothetical protein
LGYLLGDPGIKVKSFKNNLNNCNMKNVIKIGFLALSFGLFAVACGGAKTETGTDSTASAAGAAIDSAAQVATSTVDSVANAAKSTVDSAAKTIDSAAAHH